MLQKEGEAFVKKGWGYGKKGFDKAWHALDKIGTPINRLSNRIGAEAFWPMTLDKECDKAARILRSFCRDGFYTQNYPEDENDGPPDRKQTDVPAGKQKVLKKIPTDVIRQAKGLAIFTAMRTGLWISGAGGSGVLLARNPETGEWSPPSGILLHTAGVGFLAGVDIYDCVVVINTSKALESFKKLRCTLGGELSVAAGPIGVGKILDSEVHRRRAPIWSYLKSRGFYAGAQVDGTIVIERSDENERFYGERISTADIVANKVRHRPASIKTLMQTIRVVQGDLDVDESVVPLGDAPGDMVVENEKNNAFGIPDADDPDPFGVKALEKEGLFIREAGTQARPSQQAFEFRPSPTSPIFNTFAKQLPENPQPHDSWRSSIQSYKSYSSVSKSTQTDDMPTPPAPSLSRTSSRSIKDISASLDPSPWDPPGTPDEYASPDRLEQDKNFEFQIHEASNTTIAQAESAEVVASVDTGTLMRPTSPTFTRARLVTIPKRIPPPLPARNPERVHGSLSMQGSLPPPSPSPTASSRPETQGLDEQRPDKTASCHSSEITGPVSKSDAHSIENRTQSDLQTTEEDHGTVEIGEQRNGA